MKVIRNRLLPIGKNYGAINLFGVLFAKPEMRLTPAVMNHEMIHTAQMRELLYVPFYIIYVIEWIVRLFQFRFRTFEAYKHISFEREAYANGANLQYLKERSPFAMFRKTTMQRD